MKRLIALVPLMAVLTALVLLGVADSAASIADTGIPDTEAASTANEPNTSHSSANATIKVIMRTGPLPEE